MVLPRRPTDMMTKAAITQFGPQPADGLDAEEREHRVEDAPLLVKDESPQSRHRRRLSDGGRVVNRAEGQ